MRQKTQKSAAPEREHVTVSEDKDGGLTLIYYVGGVRQRKRAGRDRREAERQANWIDAMLSKGLERLAQMDLVELATFNEAFKDLGADVKLHDLIAAYRISPMRGVAPITVETAVSAYVESRHGRVDEQYFQDILKFQERFCSWFAPDTKFSSITKNQLAEFIEKHLGVNEDGTGKASRKTKLILFQKVGTVYRIARNHRPLWLNPNEPSAWEQLDSRDYVEEKKDHAIYTGEEMMRLLAQAKPEQLPFLVIGAFAGLRCCERLRITWEHYRESFNVFRLGRDVVKKSTPPRNVPVEPNLKEWLNLFERNPEAHPCPGKIRDGTFGREKRNALRASYASYHVQKYKNAPQSALNCGHSLKVQQRYLSLVYEEFSDEWFSITPDKVLEFCKTEGLPEPKWAYLVQSKVQTETATIAA
jgi:integrase